MGELTYGQADLCAAGLKLDKDRAQAIDYSIRVISSPITLIIPSKNYGLGTETDFYLDFKSYVSLFSKSVWIVLTSFGFLFSSCIIVITCHLQNQVLNIIHILSYYYLALLQIALSIKFTSKSIKYTYWLMSMFGTLMFIMYTCDLTASVTSGRHEKYPNSFDEIIQKEYEVYVTKGGLTESILKHANKGTSENVIYEMNTKLYVYPLDGNLEEWKNEVLTGTKRTFFGTTEEFIGDDRFEALTDFNNMIKTSLHLGFPKKSELTELFNFHLAKLMQSGTLEKIEQEWLKQNKPKDDMSTRIFVEDGKALGSKNLIFPGLTLVTCIILAFFMAGCELLMVKGKDMLRKPNSKTREKN